MTDSTEPRAEGLADTVERAAVERALAHCVEQTNYFDSEMVEFAQGLLAAIRALPSAAGGDTPRTAPESCPHCHDESDCSSVDICRAVDDLYPATSAAGGEDKLREAANGLLAQWELFEASHGNQEEAYYKLAKYARPHWVALRAALQQEPTK